MIAFTNPFTGRPPIHYWTIIFVGLFFCACSRDVPRPMHQDPSRSPEPQKVETLIAADSGLYGVQVHVWHKASDNAKVANAMAFVQKELYADSSREAFDTNELARELKECIDASTADMLTMQDDLVKDVARSCLLSMRFDEDIKVKRAP